MMKGSELCLVYPVANVSFFECMLAPTRICKCCSIKAVLHRQYKPEPEHENEGLCSQ